MSLIRHNHRLGGPTSERGQVLVLMVGGLLAVVILVGLVVDGGNLWAQQRIVQNGSDAAAEAGAIVLAERLAGATEPAGGWDARVATRVAASATANGLTSHIAYYTDICGIPLTSTGAAALIGNIENLAVAAQVGSGIPTSTATTPDCPALVVGPPAGVLVFGNKSADTYFASAMGFGAIGVGQRATAVSGYLQGVCDATQGNACAMLPITIPVNVVTCDGQNRPLNTRPSGRGIRSTRSRCAATVPAMSAGWTGPRPAAERASSPVRSKTRTIRRLICRRGNTSCSPATLTAAAGPATASRWTRWRTKSGIQRTDRVHPDV